MVFDFVLEGQAVGPDFEGQVLCPDYCLKGQVLGLDIFLEGQVFGPDFGLEPSVLVNITAIMCHFVGK